jgi:hypothetical protein
MKKTGSPASTAISIVLERQLLHDYDPQNALQLVSMPVYDNAITVDTVQADALGWYKRAASSLLRCWEN